MHSALLKGELQTLGDTAKVLHEVASHVTIKHEHLSVTFVMKRHLVSGSIVGDCCCCTLSLTNSMFFQTVSCPKHMASISWAKQCLQTTTNAEFNAYG